MLRYRIDVIAVLTVIITVGIQITAFLSGWPWYTIFLILLLVRQVNLVEHNHAHLRIFHHKFLNDIFDFICFLSNGVPFDFYRIHHVRNHHAHNQIFNDKEQDWSSLYGFRGTRYPDRPIGRFYYVLSFPVITICHCLIEIIRTQDSKLLRRFFLSLGLVAGISAVFISLDAWRFFLFFLLPWIVVSFGLGYNNYGHHYGCDLSNPYHSANVFLRIQHRFLGFHIGYHVAHHVKPDLHWSLLPGYHDAIRDKIPPENYRPKQVVAVGKSIQGDYDGQKNLSSG